MSSDKERAQAMKDGPNTIVEEVPGTPKPKRRRPIIVERKEPLAPAEAPRQLGAVSLAQFIALDFGPKRSDQSAGFAHHARKMGARTIPEWRAALAEFQKKPVK